MKYSRMDLELMVLKFLEMVAMGMGDLPSDGYQFPMKDFFEGYQFPS